MIEEAVYVGVDVAKSALDVAATEFLADNCGYRPGRNRAPSPARRDGARQQAPG